MHKDHEEKMNGDDRKDTVIENEWLTPKKGMTMSCVFETQRKNENKHKKLSCDEEKDEDEEHHTVLKDIESSTVASNDKKP